MQQETDVETVVRNLINTKIRNKEWWDRTSVLLGIPIKTLKKQDWYKDNWNSKWGTIEKMDSHTKNGLKWQRTDGGPDLANLSRERISTKALKFALMSRLIDLLQQTGRLSFVKVGFPENWNACKVYIGDQEIERILYADALIGSIQKTDENQETQTIAGVDVQIVVQQNPQAFF